jgi:hypothetical protein
MAEIEQTKTSIILICDCGLEHRLTKKDGEMVVKTLYKKENKKPSEIKPPIEQPKTINNESEETDDETRQTEKDAFDRFFDSE